MNPAYLFIVIFSFPFFLFSQSQTDNRYKWQNSDAIIEIINGKTDQAIDYFQQFLKTHPGDLESYYGLALAYTQKQDYEKALEYVKTGVEEGLPLARFIAGPRNLFQPLVTQKAFKRFAEGHYTPIIHGPLMGNFTDKQASFWIRTDKQRKIFLSINDQKKAFSARTLQETDFTTLITAENLQPNTTYQYKLGTASNPNLEEGSFTTFPETGKPASFQIGFGGGAGYTLQYERMWDTLLTHPLTAFFLMGDNVYIDQPEYPEIQDYCYYRRQSRPEFRRFTRSVPVFSIYDDHDFGKDDCYGGTSIHTPAWKVPVWEKFTHQYANPYYGGGKENPGCYYHFSIADVDFFMLDTRFYRTNGKDKIKPDTMLGEVQKQWLFDQLKASTATFKVIGTSVPISSGTKPGNAGNDTWDGFSEEREEIFSFIEKNKIEGVFFVAADRHRSDAWKTNRKNGYPFYEFMSSRLTNNHTHPVMPNSLFGYNKTPSFGLLEFDTTSKDPKVIYRIFNIENEEIHQMTVYKTELSFPGK